MPIINPVFTFRFINADGSDADGQFYIDASGNVFKHTAMGMWHEPKVSFKIVIPSAIAPEIINELTWLKFIDNFNHDNFNHEN